MTSPKKFRIFGGIQKRWSLFFAFIIFNLVGFNNCARGFFTTIDNSASLSSLGMANEAFTCDPNVIPPADTLVRLTGKQFQNVLYDLMSEGMNPQVSSALNNFYNRSDVKSFLASFPTEGLYGKGNSLVYDTEDQRISNPMIKTQLNLAFAAASYISSNPALLTYFVRHFANSPNCNATAITNAATPRACYDDFIKGFGLRILRRPVETASNPIDASAGDPTVANDLSFYERYYTDTTNGGFDSLITGMMISPDSLFFMHVKGTVTSGSTNIISLTNYEIAAKMAFYYTDSAPDSNLIAASAQNFTGAGNTVEDQANRLFSSSRARGRLDNFYTQWIRPTAIPPLTVSTNSPSTDLGQLRSNAIQEMLDLTEFYTFDAPQGKFSDVIANNISFAKTADLAAIYGTDVWQGKNADGTIDSSKLVRFPPSSPRSGLFTRAGYAFSGARDNNPIIRGARIRKDYFCENLNPPAAFNLSTDIAMSGPPTIRNIVVANTEGVGTSCAGCHAGQINPLGFALENYDSFGRYRNLEPIFDPTTGVILKTVPIDSSAQPLLTSNDPIKENDPITYSQHLGMSIEANSCFVRHYFRYSQARNEDTSADGCKLNRMMSSLVEGPNASIQSMVKSVTNSQDFRTRAISP